MTYYLVSTVLYCTFVHSRYSHNFIQYIIISGAQKASVILVNKTLLVHFFRMFFDLFFIFHIDNKMYILLLMKQI